MHFVCVCVVENMLHEIYHFNQMKVQNSGALSAFTVLCILHDYLVPELVHHPKWKPCIHYAFTPHSLHTLLARFYLAFT